MFKIGEFSKLGQVSVRMLRHYDQMGLLKPGHTDKWTGYRYYTLEQLARLNRIVALNGLGLTLQQIGDLLAKDDQLPVERLRGMLMLRRAEIERELQEKQFQLAFVKMIEAEIGKPIKVRVAGRWLLAAVGLFNPALREMNEMMYEFEEPYIVDHRQFAAAFGDHAPSHRQALGGRH